MNECAHLPVDVVVFVIDGGGDDDGGTHCDWHLKFRSIDVCLLSVLCCVCACFHELFWILFINARAAKLISITDEFEFMKFAQIRAHKVPLNEMRCGRIFVFSFPFCTCDAVRYPKICISNSHGMEWNKCYLTLTRIVSLIHSFFVSFFFYSKRITRIASTFPSRNNVEWESGGGLLIWGKCSWKLTGDTLVFLAISYRHRINDQVRKSQRTHTQNEQNRITKWEMKKFL